MRHELFYMDLLEIGRQIQSRRRSSVDVTQAMLERIQRIDTRLHSYVSLFADHAVAEARQADDEIAFGRIRSPLHGVPIAIKDLLWTTDAPTSHGTVVHKDFLAPEDATVVVRLRDAGAVLLGKLQMTEGAFASHHPAVAVPVNPWKETLWSGVSSSGSGVATAAGLCFASLGTDTGGSIRFPSAANGITGLKPTWGRVSRHGAFALAASMDHIGPMARSAADAAAVLQVIAGADPKDPTASQAPVPDYLALMTRGFSGLTVGFDASWSSDRVDEATQSVVRDVMNVVTSLGGIVRDVVFPGDTKPEADWAALCSVETALEHEATYPARQKEYGPVLAGLIEQGRKITAMEFQRLTMQRSEFRGRLNAMFASGVDLLLAPVTPAAGMSIEFVDETLADPERLNDLLRFTSPFDLSGHPTITLPGGRTSGDAPIAFQFVAPEFREDLAIRAGWAYQQITNWHQRHPSI